MSSRTRSRERALQILFPWDSRNQPVDEAIDAYSRYPAFARKSGSRDAFVADLVRGTVEHVAETGRAHHQAQPSIGAWSACPPWTAMCSVWPLMK